MHRLQPFEQISKRVIYGVFLASLVKIMPLVKEEVAFEAIAGDTQHMTKEYQRSVKQ